jgi:hypothetical protein
MGSDTVEVPAGLKDEINSITVGEPEAWTREGRVD